MKRIWNKDPLDKRKQNKTKQREEKRREEKIFRKLTKKRERERERERERGMNAMKERWQLIVAKID
jgi:hypothetical protein